MPRPKPATKPKPKKATRKQATEKRKRLRGAAKLAVNERIALEERRAQVVRLRSLGVTFTQIAERLKISVTTAWEDEQSAIKRASALTDKETIAFKSRETEKLLAQEQELAIAWVESKGATGGMGDPRYLDARTRTLARLHKLNGLDAPEKLEADVRADLLSLTVVTKKGGAGGTDARAA